MEKFYRLPGETRMNKAKIKGGKEKSTGVLFLSLFFFFFLIAPPFLRLTSSLFARLAQSLHAATGKGHAAQPIFPKACIFRFSIVVYVPGQCNNERNLRRKKCWYKQRNETIRS